MIDRYAAVVCDWSLEVGPGTRLLVEGPLEAKALATAVAAHAWRAGAAVSVHLRPEWSGDHGLVGEIAEAFDAVCEIVPSEPPPTSDLSSGLRRVCCSWPTDRTAQRQGLGTLRLAETVFSACLLDRTDPVAAWREVAARNERARARLGIASRLSVAGIELAISGAVWEHEAGRTRLPGAFVKAALLEGTLVIETGRPEVSASLDGRQLQGAIALDGVVAAW